MNKRLAIEEFGYQDFILVKAPKADVLEALCEITLENDISVVPEPAASWKSGGVVKMLLERLPFGRSAEPEDALEDETPDTEETPPAPFGLHEGEAAHPVELLTTERGPAYMQATQPSEPPQFHDDIRVSSIDGSDWVLIEYRELVSGVSLLSYSLSTKLEGRDVLYFRRSGDLICEYHNDFHVYQDGETLRRVLCHSTWPEGDIEQEWWESILDGEITVYEPEELYQDVGEMDLLDNDKLEEILAKLALSSQKLFSRVLTCDPVLLSRRPGGTPLVPID